MALKQLKLTEQRTWNKDKAFDSDNLKIEKMDCIFIVKFNLRNILKNIKSK